MLPFHQIEVGNAGQQSSVAFADVYRTDGPGRGTYQAMGKADDGGYPIRTTQDPIYPTVSLAGGSGGVMRAGVRGTISKGNPVYNTDATAGGKGGAGWVGAAGQGVGAGAGGDAGAPGRAGAVLVVIELLAGGE